MVLYTILFLTFTYRYLHDLPVSRQRNLLSWAYFRFLTGVPRSRGKSTPEVPLEELAADGSRATTIEEGKAGGAFSQGLVVQPGDRVKGLLVLCALSTVFIFIRSIFR